MKMKKQATKIQEVIRTYAAAYDALQDRQDESPLIPKGDQKTGCIGEFYSYLYLCDTFPDATLSYGNHSQKGWDIQVSVPGGTVFKVQVKTVSAYSTTRTISPIHHGWDELHLLYLNRMLGPQGFWIIRDRSIVTTGIPLTSKKCPIPGQARTGSKGIPFGENRIEDLRGSISQYISA